MHTMAQAKTLTPAEIEQLLSHINTRKYAARNRSMMLLAHWAGLRIGEVAGLRWSDVTTTDGLVKDEIRLLPDMTKGRHARTVFVSAKLKAELQAYATQATCVDRNQGIVIHLLKTLTGHRSISTTAAYLYSSPNLLKAAVELA
jgi:integrase/recombinase XerD